MKLYFNDVCIGYTDSDNLYSHIKAFLHGMGITSLPYYRTWVEKTDEGYVTVIDYGSHNNFFYIKYD